MKPIEEIEVGDLVWAWDEDQSALVKRRVKRLFRRKHRSVLQVLCVDHDTAVQTITATTEHPFWIEGKGWVAAHALRAGDVLKCMDGASEMSVLRIEDTGTRADVFNFEVEDAHNYFVGDRGVLVHNESNQRAAFIVLDEQDVLGAKRTVVTSERNEWPSVMRGSRRLDAYAAQSNNTLLYGHGNALGFGGVSGDAAVDLIVRMGLNAGGAGRGLEIVTCKLGDGPVPRAVAATGKFTRVVSYTEKMTTINGVPEAVVPAPAVLATHVDSDGTPVILAPRQYAKRVTLPLLQDNPGIGPLPTDSPLRIVSPDGAPPLPPLPRVDTLGSGPLVDGVRSTARQLIAAGDTSGIALARAEVPALGVVSPDFVNIRWGQSARFPGVVVPGDGTYGISDAGRYVSGLRDIYARNGSSLSQGIEQSVRRFASENPFFASSTGLPGMHAEVQALNYLYGNVPKLSKLGQGQVQIAVAQLLPGRGQGGPMLACTNCGSIIPSWVDLITGRR